VKINQNNALKQDGVGWL